MSEIVITRPKKKEQGALRPFPAYSGGLEDSRHTAGHNRTQLNVSDFNTRPRRCSPQVMKACALVPRFALRPTSSISWYYQHTTSKRWLGFAKALISVPMIDPGPHRGQRAPHKPLGPSGSPLYERQQEGVLLSS